MPVRLRFLKQLVQGDAVVARRPFELVLTLHLGFSQSHVQFGTTLTGRLEVTPFARQGPLHIGQFGLLFAALRLQTVGFLVQFTHRLFQGPDLTATLCDLRGQGLDAVLV